MTLNQSNRWVTRPKPQPQAALRLFCLPYSGGGVTTYTSWASLLPPQVELCPLQLPGRENRLKETAFTTMPALVAALVPNLLPLLDKPFALFGHSMGALIAFEVARALRREHGKLPVLLAASGHRAPHLPDPHPPAHTMPDPELLDELRRLNGTPPEVLQHPELLQLVLPLLRADFAVCETYGYHAEPPLDCPIVAFSGLEDPDVSRDEASAWRAQTTKSFALRMFPGDHFFVNSHRQLVIQTLARELVPFLK